MLRNLHKALKSNAKLNYIVGNSSFYGYFVDTEKILSESMRKIGYNRIQIQNIRRRNTKKGLYEFNVRAVWNLKSKIIPIRSTSFQKRGIITNYVGNH